MNDLDNQLCATNYNRHHHQNKSEAVEEILSRCQQSATNPKAAAESFVVCPPLVKRQRHGKHSQPSDRKNYLRNRHDVYSRFNDECSRSDPTTLKKRTGTGPESAATIGSADYGRSCAYASTLNRPPCLPSSSRRRGNSPKGVIGFNAAQQASVIHISGLSR
jgi:hypothetical protein